MAYQAILVVLLASVIALSSAVGCVPAVPTADGSVNPVSYNALASSFSLNGPNTTDFDSSLLNVRASVASLPCSQFSRSLLCSGTTLPTVP